METAGVRLTRSGWNRSRPFFVNPIAFPEKQELFVVASNASVSDAVVQDSKAEVTVDIRPLGQIGTELQFTPPDTYKASVLYTLIIIDKDTNHVSEKHPAKQHVSIPQWRIANPPGPIVWVAVDAAIRYVVESRNSSNDPAIMKNADQTLAKLKSLR